MSECPVHDKQRFDLGCSCSVERQWARKKLLQESLEAIAHKPAQNKDGGK